jgi:hypothetical protein
MGAYHIAQQKILFFNAYFDSTLFSICKIPFTRDCLLDELLQSKNDFTQKKIKKEIQLYKDRAKNIYNLRDKIIFHADEKKKIIQSWILI